MLGASSRDLDRCVDAVVVNVLSEEITVPVLRDQAGAVVHEVGRNGAVSLDHASAPRVVGEAGDVFPGGDVENTHKPVHEVVATLAAVSADQVTVAVVRQRDATDLDVLVEVVDGVGGRAAVLPLQPAVAGEVVLPARRSGKS